MRDRGRAACTEVTRNFLPWFFLGYFLNNAGRIVIQLRNATERDQEGGQLQLDCPRFLLLFLNRDGSLVRRPPPGFLAARIESKTAAGQAAHPAAWLAGRRGAGRRALQNLVTGHLQVSVRSDNLIDYWDFIAFGVDEYWTRQTIVNGRAKRAASGRVFFYFAFFFFLAADVPVF